MSGLNPGRKLNSDVRSVLLGEAKLSPAAKEAAEKIVKGFESLLRDPNEHNKGLFLVATHRVLTSSTVDVSKELMSVLVKVKEAFDTKLNELSERNALNKQSENVLKSAKNDIIDIKTSLKKRF